MYYEMRRKLVIVGDGAVGKTSLGIVFSENKFPESYVPTVMGGCVMSIEVKHHPVQLAIWDTIARGDFEERLRPLAYVDAHAFLLCFSVDNPESLENIEEKWIIELRHYIGDSAPIYLVGCKIDLRTHAPTLAHLAARGQSIIMAAQGEEMAKNIGAAAYLECSSKTGEGVRIIFLHALEAMDDNVVSRVNAKWSRRNLSKKTHCVVM